MKNAAVSIALGLAGLIASGPSFSDHIPKRILKQSLDMVVEHTTTIVEVTEVEKDGVKVQEESEIDIEGTGFVIGDLYITSGHVVIHDERVMRTPFGIIKMPINKKSEKTYIEGREIIPLIKDKESDIAVFRLTPDLCADYCNKAQIARKPRVGDTAYVIANPGISGKTLETGHISRTDYPYAGPEEEKSFKGGYGFDRPFMKGTSGSPCFDRHGRVQGVAQFNYQNVGYCKSINEYVEALRSIGVDLGRRPRR